MYQFLNTSSYTNSGQKHAQKIALSLNNNQQPARKMFLTCSLLNHIVMKCFCLFKLVSLLGPLSGYLETNLKTASISSMSTIPKGPWPFKLRGP